MPPFLRTEVHASTTPASTAPHNLRTAPSAQKTLMSGWIASVNPQLPRREASVRSKPCRRLRKGLAWPLSPFSSPSCCSHSRIVIQSPLCCHSPSWPWCVLFPLLDCPFPLSAPGALLLLTSSSLLLRAAFRPTAAHPTHLLLTPNRHCCSVWEQCVYQPEGRGGSWSMILALMPRAWPLVGIHCSLTE